MSITVGFAGERHSRRFSLLALPLLRAYTVRIATRRHDASARRDNGFSTECQPCTSPLLFFRANIAPKVRGVRPSTSRRTCSDGRNAPRIFSGTLRARSLPTRPSANARGKTRRKSRARKRFPREPPRSPFHPGWRFFFRVIGSMFEGMRGGVATTPRFQPLPFCVRLRDRSLATFAHALDDRTEADRALAGWLLRFGSRTGDRFAVVHGVFLGTVPTFGDVRQTGANSVTF